MKTKQIILPFIAFVALYLSACQKDFTAPTSTTETTPTTSLNYLTRSYSLFSVSAGSTILDTAERSHYAYDNLKRLTTILDTSNEAGLPSTIRFGKQIFTYNGVDSFVSVLSSYGFVPGSLIRDTSISYFSYNVAGKLVSDSTINSYRIGSILVTKSKIIRLLNYVGNKIYTVSTTTTLFALPTAPPPSIERDTITLDTRGNVTEQKTGTFYNNPSQNDKYTSVIQTFDNNPSPLSAANGGSYISANGKNNVLKSQGLTVNIGTSSPPQIFNLDYTGGYTYNTLGYPIISNFVEVPSTGIQYRNTFYYTTL
jgi:hypothetical protein